MYGTCFPSIDNLVVLFGEWLGDAGVYIVVVCGVEGGGRDTAEGSMWHRFHAV